jgi:hypothetical protein
MKERLRLQHLFWGLILSLWSYTHCFALDLPRGWTENIDPQNNTHAFQPIENSANLLVKYYPKQSLKQQDISDWLRDKLSNSKAPEGIWLESTEVIRDTANQAHSIRKFRKPDGVTRYLVAVAYTADREYVRLAILLYDEKKHDKNILQNQAYPILLQIDEIEIADADQEGREKDIEASPPTFSDIKSGGPIKPGRYLGVHTWKWKDQIKGYYEVVLYNTGEYEFLRGYGGESGHYTYSRATGRLNLHEDFYNSTYSPKEDYCFLGVKEKTGVHTIRAREDEDRYRLNWVGPVDRLSPNQRKRLDKMKNSSKASVTYRTTRGAGLSEDQIETILYTYEENDSRGGIEIDEEIYLLMKDGRVRDGLPVSPNRLDVAKSRSREPGRWGWWKYDGEHYQFAWNIDRKNYAKPDGKQSKTYPIPKGTRLSGKWGASRSSFDIHYSSASFWGVWLDKDGRFKKYHNGSMQAGSVGVAGGLVTAYSSDKGSSVSALGSHVGGGTHTRKNGPDSHRMGSYEFDGYNLILKYDNGMVKHLAAFATDDKFRGIWFEGGRLSRRD